MVSLATEPSGAGAFYAARTAGEKRKMSNASKQDAWEMTGALLDAAADGDAAALAALLASGAGADAREAPGGDTPLMRAAARGHAEAARVLLDAGADASAQRADGFTPLVLAVFYGHEAVARLLVARGADPTARTSLGTTAARWAAARGFEGMARMLREAEATRPRPAAPEIRESASAVRTKAHEGRADSPGGNTKAAASSPRTSSSDEVSIFVRKEPRADTNAATDAPAASVSVRSGGGVPVHPSASAFHLGHFLRSWQGSVGVALILLAFAVSVFALLRGGRTAGVVAPTASAPTAPQAAAPQPAQQLPVPQPSPTPPSEPGQVMPLTDPALVAPSTAGQPYYVPLGPAQSDAPRELMVVSEGGAGAAEDAGRTKRKTDANANSNAAPAPTPDGRGGESSGAADNRAPRNTRPAEAEQRPASPAASPPPAPPATQPTPRAKVIQWPPQ